MGVRDHDSPPTEWCDWWTDVHQLTPDITYGWPRNEDPSDNEPNPWFWHWCPTQGRWNGAATSNHTLVSREPLHLEPSLLWPCCGTHGFVRGGQWINA
ncbi:hypothetical protein [Streptomyces sp. NPDC004008]